MKVFISYAHEDQAAARRLVDALAREGLDAWWDHQIPPGSTWDEIIGTRIAAAGVVIAVWSKRSIGSNFVKEEAQLAYDAGKLLPVRIDDIEPPVGFRRVHAANLVGWRGDGDHAQWRALLAEIRQRLRMPAAARSAPARPKRKESGLALGLLTAALVVTGAAYVLLPLLERPARQGAPPVLSEAAQPMPTTPASAPADPQAEERRFWRSCCTGEATTAADYRRYLDRYGDGAYAVQARERLAALQTPREPARSAPSVAGTLWRGTRTISTGSARLCADRGASVDEVIHFRPDQSVSDRMMGAGSYAQSGDRVVVTHRWGSISVTVSGDTMTGSFRYNMSGDPEGDCEGTVQLRRSQS